MTRPTRVLVWGLKALCTCSPASFTQPWRMGKGWEHGCRPHTPLGSTSGALPMRGRGPRRQGPPLLEKRLHSWGQWPLQALAWGNSPSLECPHVLKLKARALGGIWRASNSGRKAKTEASREALSELPGLGPRRLLNTSHSCPMGPQHFHTANAGKLWSPSTLPQEPGPWAQTLNWRHSEGFSKGWGSELLEVWD